MTRGWRAAGDRSFRMSPDVRSASAIALGRQKLIASTERPGMALWRERLFAWMSQSSESAMEFFKLPTNRVVELGSQLQI